jgi:trehalose/maltose hydrolase-like predicted phosphorylase
MTHPVAQAQGAWLEAWAQDHVAAATPDEWVLREHGYNPIREPGVESRFTVANGFLGVRGSRAGSRGPTWVSWLHHFHWASWPRTYVAGLFDVPDMQPAVPALVPAPDWLRYRIVLDGLPLVLRSGELLMHERTLDMAHGSLRVEWSHRTNRDVVVRLHSLRLVSLAERSLGLQLVQFVVNRPGPISFEAWLDVANAGLELVQIHRSLGVWRTSATRKQLAIASAAGLHADGERLELTSEVNLTRIWNWAGLPDQRITFWRLVSFARGDDPWSKPAEAARASLRRAQQVGLRQVLQNHHDAWAERWHASDIRVTGDPSSQRSLRYAVYHLNGAANPDDQRVSIGARGLTGDAYLGHVFWDTDIFLLPFYTLTWPEAARSLLMYRYRTLPAARAKAAHSGYRGALYAWESADTGEETTPSSIMDPSGRVLEVLAGGLEQHISADVAYAVWQYWRATDDVDFLLDAGAEIILDTARFWASRVVLESDGRYHIRDVIGPDEYHEHVDDNAYTNQMARWNLERGLEVAELASVRWPGRWVALSSALRLDPVELAHWQDVANKLVDGQHQNGLLEQFAGYFELEDIDLRQYEGRLVPMDVVLGRERTQASQVIKQADVVMLLALLNDRFDRQVQERNFAYYEPRCGQGSSLSRAMHALVAARLGDVATAERYFRDAAATDFVDTDAGVGGGIRIAALGGVWQVAVFGFAGLALRDWGIRVDPCLPPTWDRLAFRIRFRHRRLFIEADGASKTASVRLELGEPLEVEIGAEKRTLAEGDIWCAHWG